MTGPESLAFAGRTGFTSIPFADSAGFFARAVTFCAGFRYFSFSSAQGAGFFCFGAKRIPIDVSGLVIFFNFSGACLRGGRTAVRAAGFFHSGSLTEGALKLLMSLAGFAWQHPGAFAQGAGYFSGILAEGTGPPGHEAE